MKGLDQIILSSFWVFFSSTLVSNRPFEGDSSVPNGTVSYGESQESPSLLELQRSPFPVFTEQLSGPLSGSITLQAWPM